MYILYSTLSVPYVLRGAKKVVPPTLSARLKESKLAKIARVVSLDFPSYIEMGIVTHFQECKFLLYFKCHS